MQITKLFLIIFLITLTFLPCIHANKPIASVNSSGVIFDYDIIEHIKYLEITNNKDSQKQLLSKDNNINNVIFNKLVDTYLIKEQAVKFGISVSDEEFNNAFNNLAKALNYGNTKELIKVAIQKGFTPSRFQSLLQEDILVDKFKQSISFSRALASENEIAVEMDKMLDLNGKVEFLLYEISIIDINPEASAKKLKLIQDNLNTSNFESIAKKFSDNITAINGGFIGWVPQVYLSPNILNVLNKMPPNSISPPIIIGNTYKILYLKEVRGLLNINPSNPDHLKRLNEYAKQKVIFDKVQIILEDYMKELYQNASIIIYEDQYK